MPVCPECDNRFDTCNYCFGTGHVSSATMAERDVTRYVNPNNTHTETRVSTQTIQISDEDIKQACIQWLRGKGLLKQHDVDPIVVFELENTYNTGRPPLVIASVKVPI
jgi:hypothetical protein